MSDNNWDYDEDETPAVDDSKLVKDLRKQLKQASEALGALQAKDRERSVNSALSRVPDEKRAKIAKFIPADADAEAWLTENADLFGLNLGAEKEAPVQPEAPAPEQPAVDPAQQAAMQAIQRASQTGTPANADQQATFASQLQQLKVDSPNDIDNFIKAWAERGGR